MAQTAEQKRRRKAKAGKAKRKMAPFAPSMATPPQSHDTPGVRLIDRTAERNIADATAYDTSVKARAGRFGMTKANAKQQEAGTSLGRLYQADKITYAEMEAGKRMGEVTWKYLQSLDAPAPTAQGQDMHAVRSEVDSVEENVERTKSLRDRYKAMRSTVHAMHQGQRTWNLLYVVCVEDRGGTADEWSAPELDRLRTGLQAIG